MASNRLEKIGTIFTRTTGLLKSGAMKPADKPLWYDVYEAFPPKLEPRFDRKVQEKPIRNILYPEDVVRAQFYKKFSSPGTIRLSEDSHRPTLCQLFVEEYERLQSEGSTPTEKLMDEAVLALESRGIYLDPTRSPPKVEADTEQVPVSEPSKEHGRLKEKVRLADIFKESQE
ncbi:small ribosomal subunit protein mS23 [Palaemon carinicauda]|uniref:small ribosomal subunit protein mS23 n=1 Tax=Palaemon carinicauda TaxID=392227 RepID=UPI0035B64C08